MIMHRSKKRENVCKAKTVSNTLDNFFVFSYEITFRHPNTTPFV